MKQNNSTTQPVQGIFKQVAEMPATYTFGAKTDAPLSEQAVKLAEMLYTKFPTLDPKRIERAVVITQRHDAMRAKYDQVGQSIKPTDRLWVVAGSKGWYFVDTEAKTCTCPDAQKGNICKHRISVYIEHKFAAEYQKIITAPANRAHSTHLSADRCETCGQLLTTPRVCGNLRHKAAQQNSREVQQFIQAASVKKFCVACLGPNEQESRTCEYCGTKLTPAETTTSTTK